MRSTIRPNYLIRSDFFNGHLGPNSYWRRAVVDMPLRVRARFVQTIESYLAALEQEVSCRIANDFVSVDAFIVMRRETSAVRTVLALMEFASGLDLPDDVFGHPSIALLVQLANDLISWTNVSPFFAFSTPGDAQERRTGYLLLQWRTIQRTDI